MNQWMVFLFLLLPGVVGASERLVSNFTYAVAPGESVGELKALARGDVLSGISTLSLGVQGGQVQLLGITSETLDPDWTLVHDRVFADFTGEFRRTPWALSPEGALWFPLFGKKEGSFVKPLGVVSSQEGLLDEYDLGVDTLWLQDSLAKDPLNVTVGALAFQGDSLWLAQGVGGLVLYSPTAKTGQRWFLNPQSGQWVPAQAGDSVRVGQQTPIYGLALAGDSLWLATAQGLWRRGATGNVGRSGHPFLDTARVTGVWYGGQPSQLFVETSKRNGLKTDGSLWRSLDQGKTFAPVLPSYDSLDLTVSHVAFLGSEAWLAVQRTEGLLSGLLRVNPTGPVPWADSLPAGSQAQASRWVWGLDAKVVDRDVYVTGVCTFPLETGRMGLALSTDGGGVSVSADSGKTWKAILNQVAVRGDLSQIRMVPSVLRFQGATSLIAYRLSQTAKVTIEIFSYDMKKVRTVVRGATRLSDPVRSSDPRVDVWDGLDDSGKPVAMGIYYVKVQDNKGHVGWGKVMTMGGRP